MPPRCREGEREGGSPQYPQRLTTGGGPTQVFSVGTRQRTQSLPRRGEIGLGRAFAACSGDPRMLRTLVSRVNSSDPIRVASGECGRACVCIAESASFLPSLLPLLFHFFCPPSLPSGNLYSLRPSDSVPVRVLPLAADSFSFASSRLPHYVSRKGGRGSPLAEATAFKMADGESASPIGPRARGSAASPPVTRARAGAAGRTARTVAPSCVRCGGVVHVVIPPKT